MDLLEKGKGVLEVGHSLHAGHLGGVQLLQVVQMAAAFVHDVLLGDTVGVLTRLFAIGGT